MSDAAEVVVREGTAFAQRNRDLSPDAQSMGALAWGLLRAVAECPHCPGVYRTWHYDANNDEIWTCPHCQRQWKYVPPQTKEALHR